MSADSRDSRCVATGVPGLDEVLHGGIPRGSLVLVEGRPGSGKTTIALQFLLHGHRDGESCLMASNAESPEQLRSIAASHRWNLDGLHLIEWSDPQGAAEEEGDNYTLFPEAEVEVGETLQYFFTMVDRLQPTLLVIDTISALRVLAPTPAFYRRQLRRIRDFLYARSCTTLLLDDASLGEKDTRSQTIADGILELRQIDYSFGSDRRRLRVRKMRGATYVAGAHDFTIQTGGLTVYPRLVAQNYAKQPRAEPLRCGVAEIDTLSGGGLPRGTATLVLGPAGIGKSTLTMLYAMAAARQNENCSILLFDESAETYIARSRGLGFDIERAMESGHIRLHHLDPAELSSGQISNLLLREVEGERIGAVVIDTLNGYLQSAAEEPNVLLQLRELISYLGRRAVVTLLTMTQHGILGPDMVTPIDMSFLADNVFLMRYFESEGSIRQALSMVKKRTGEHERTIRQLSMKSGQITVSEPLKNFTGVLSGTPQYIGSGLPRRN